MSFKTSQSSASPTPSPSLSCMGNRARGVEHSVGAIAGNTNGGGIGRQRTLRRDASEDLHSMCKGARGGGVEGAEDGGLELGEEKSGEEKP
jgi:hypothetical protein